MLRIACLTALVIVALACGPAAIAEKTWDVGVALDGEMLDNAIVLPISLESPSTDTMTCEPADPDHWIDAEQSEPEDEGTDPDAWGSWGETKCWWTALGGTVSQGDWTTTYTAPETEGGVYPIECSIEDLPKTCESGTRDDARGYVGTEDGTGHPHAIAYSAVLQKLHSPSGVRVMGPLKHPEYKGNRYVSDITTPDPEISAFGFWKKIEWVATITPGTTPPGGQQFEWVQKFIGEGVLDGHADLYASQWDDDSPGQAFRTNVMGRSHRIYMLDGPGAFAGDSDLPLGEHWTHFRAVGDPDHPMRYINKVEFGGKQISTNYWQTASQDWTRHLRISKPDGGPWVVVTNN